MNLSAHFTYEEMVLSETASRLGLDNTPDSGVLANLERTCAYLEIARAAIQEHFGDDKVVIVTSGYRSQAVNQAVGGVPTSAHCFGRAADIHVPGVMVLELAQFLAANLAGYDQLIHEFGTWVHVGLAEEGEAPRVQQLTIGRFAGGAGVETKVGILPLP